MSSLAPVSAGTLLRQPSLIFFLLSRSLSRFSSQIGAVAIGWQVYDLTGSAFDLGMVGLVQFLPTALLVFVAGHAADRFERKRVVACDVVELALQKNLDIAVERINPSAVDLQIAGVKNTYLPVATSTIGQRDVYQLPRDQLQGGDRVSVGTTKPRTRSSVFAHTTATSAIGPLVIHILPPLRIQSEPSRRAWVRMPPGFEPKSGSVSPKQPIASPAAILGSHSRFCSSLPNRQIANMASEPCTETMLRSPESAASSSRQARP